MTPLKRAVALGLTAGIYAIAGVYLVVTYLPRPFALIIPIGMLALPIAFFWPAWFDRDRTDRWGRRMLRRLVVLGGAVPVAAVTSFLAVAAVPAYLAWGENLHRQSLSSGGLSAVEIEAAVTEHRQTPVHFLRDGAIGTAMPGLIAALVTTAAGAIVLRKRPSRP